jgi:hypothetical protein
LVHIEDFVGGVPASVGREVVEGGWTVGLVATDRSAIPEPGTPLAKEGGFAHAWRTRQNIDGAKVNDGWNGIGEGEGRVWSGCVHELRCPVHVQWVVFTDSYDE